MKKKTTKKVVEKTIEMIEKKPANNFLILNKNCMHNGKIYDKGTKIYTFDQNYNIFKAVNER